MKAWVQIPLLTGFSLRRCTSGVDFSYESLTITIGDGGIVVSMVAFQAIDPSSILGHRNKLFI
ncbi:Uncharacterized protein APZ42_003628 [Daphnia magna]|uniref:Uncharacterized protein n=1 Tax=Daphnia magna TaxID=35525 RepID=A0A168ELU0_9CRUS|nr:Uncharacterized protein APZ42_003628 [Daphnia magna]